MVNAPIGFEITFLSRSRADFKNQDEVEWEESPRSESIVARSEICEITGSACVRENA